MKSFVIVHLPKARFPFMVGERNGDLFNVIASFEEKNDSELFIASVASPMAAARRKEASCRTP